MYHEDGASVNFGSADLETVRPSTVVMVESDVCSRLRSSASHQKGLDRSGLDRHGSLALALVGTGPSFWSHHQAERGSFLWTNPGEEGLVF